MVCLTLAVAFPWKIEFLEISSPQKPHIHIWSKDGRKDKRLASVSREGLHHDAAVNHDKEFRIIGESDSEVGGDGLNGD
jgi:hypothetical protein